MIAGGLSAWLPQPIVELAGEPGSGGALTAQRRGGHRSRPKDGLDSRRWLALVVVLVAGFMDLLDATIVNVAVPSIQTDLGAEYAQLEWIVASYVLAFAAVLITGGRLGDIYGRKRLFIVGMGGFTLASAWCGLATGPDMLIAARFFQGATAGLMVPQILAIIHVTFPPRSGARSSGCSEALSAPRRWPARSLAGCSSSGTLPGWAGARSSWSTSRSASRRCSQRRQSSRSRGRQQRPSSTWSA